MADLEVTPFSKIILLAKRWPSELKLNLSQNWNWICLRIETVLEKWCHLGPQAPPKCWPVQRNLKSLQVTHSDSYTVLFCTLWLFHHRTVNCRRWAQLTKFLNYLPTLHLWSRTTQLLTEAHIEWLAAVVGSTPTYELHRPANNRSTHWMASSWSASIEEVHLLINFTTQLIADAYIEVGTTPLMNSHQPAIIQLE